MPLAHHPDQQRPRLRCFLETRTQGGQDERQRKGHPRGSIRSGNSAIGSNRDLWASVNLQWFNQLGLVDLAYYNANIARGKNLIATMRLRQGYRAPGPLPNSAALLRRGSAYEAPVLQKLRHFN